MKITVRFGTYNADALELQYTGRIPPEQFRLVTINLTKSQTAKLIPRKLGVNEGLNIWETREVIALED